MNTTKKILIGQSNPKYKTKLCSNWVRYGMCPYYEKCQFAHGYNDYNFNHYNYDYYNYMLQLDKQIQKKIDDEDYNYYWKSILNITNSAQ
jgi:hypothetical protein